MSYIYPHTSSKILKLGIKWALYREKKPEEEQIPDGTEHPATHEPLFWMKNPEYTKWQQSFIAYLKEPEFKEFNVGDTIYYKEKKYTISIGDHEADLILVDGMPSTNIHLSRTEDQFLSHYYPGQQVESFKYVREIYAGDLLGNYARFKWQEVEEPEEDIIIKSKGEKDDIIQDTQWDTNPEYTQFQEDKKQGKILAEI